MKLFFRSCKKAAILLAKGKSFCLLFLTLAFLMPGHAYGKQFDLPLKDQQFIFVDAHKTENKNINNLSAGKKDMFFATKAQFNFCLRQLSLPADFSEFPTFAKTRIYKPQNDP